MILSDIKEYLVKHKRVILGGLAVHFGTEPEAMKGMLDLWIRKGRVVKSDARACCAGSCGKCAEAAAMEIYEWRS